MMQQITIDMFKKIIWENYRDHGRSFVWRHTDDPYHIVVSEIMLQQTQTHRVEPKFEQFIATFPDFATLSDASVSAVITCWQGLGYNRRALALQKIAQIVMNNHDGMLPQSPELLVTFPGIGPNTAGSICAFAFNKPTVFIETNIRSVFIHFFFRNKTNVTDKEIYPLVEMSVDQENPREWYYALMDYGVMLKKQLPNPSRKSAHHVKQSKFEGSERQIRGMILKVLTQHKQLSYTKLCLLIDRAPERIEKNLQTLCVEGFIKRRKDNYCLG